jgi:ribonuclease HI
MTGTETFFLYADGSSLNNPGPSGAGALLFDRSGGLIFRLSLPLGHATNNIAEYQALILGAGEALERGVEDIEIRMDSTLVVNQVNGRWRVGSPHLLRLRDLAQKLLEGFRSWKLSYVPREANRLADEAAKEASGLDAARRGKAGRQGAKG